MFSETDASRPVLRSELEGELRHYATKDDFRLHIREVERLVSSLGAITKALSKEASSQDGVEDAEKPQNHLIHELKQRIDSQSSFGTSFDNGLLQIRISSIQSNCDRLRDAVEHLETRVLKKLEAMETLGAGVIEKLEIMERVDAQIVEKLEAARGRTRRPRQ